jgi:hypothetical protein
MGSPIIRHPTQNRATCLPGGNFNGPLRRHRQSGNVNLLTDKWHVEPRSQFFTEQRVGTALRPNLMVHVSNRIEDALAAHVTLVK